MESISLTPTRNASTFRFSIPCFSNPRQCKNLSFPRKLKKFVVFASKDEQQLNSWDQMELKFGKLIGEDPKLTMAKIIGRKLNPEMTYLEIEKSFNKKKGKYEIEEVPFDVSDGRKSPDSLDGLNLVRPVPKKGVKFETSDKPLAPRIKRPSQPVVKAVDNPRGSVPNVILRRPSTYNDDDIGTEKSPRLSIKPNLSLRMGNEQPKERFSDMTLVRKPAPFLKKEEDPSKEGKTEGSRNTEDNSINSVPVATGTYTDFSLLQKPEKMNYQDPEASEDQNVSSSDIESSENGLTVNSTAEMENVTNINDGSSWEDGDVSKLQDLGQGNSFLKGSQPLEQSDIVSSEKSAATTDTEKKVANSDSGISIDAALKERPKRLDQPVNESSKIGKGVLPLVNLESYGNDLDYGNLPATPLLKEREDADWRRAEDLIKTAGRADVELISSSTRGFVASFGSLIGFLPYRNLATKWKYLAFESWLRRKGVDPSMYRQSLGIIGAYDATNNVAASDSRDDSKIVTNAEGQISSDMKLEELLAIYDREKLKYLSSFVGQKVKVNVILADKASRKLIFSVKPKEKEESIEKKRSLMAKLSVGDVVKCCIKKITYFGVFVEVEGVPALIHQTEVSWDATLDPTSYFKIGQVLEAKVHQLDFSLERIFLSLKEITPDPLTETLEAVVGDRAFMDGRLQAAQAEDEWADVESLVKELQRYEGVQSVSKGRFFLSPGLAPTFQVYMGSMFEDQYKLLARAGNKVQEVIVQTSLNKEEMKSAILTCTNRVE